MLLPNSIYASINTISADEFGPKPTFLENLETGFRIRQQHPPAHTNRDCGFQFLPVLQRLLENARSIRVNTLGIIFDFCD